ncbi:MAG: methyltransferase domain-containing protein [Alphaproteobacteria bacterium]|jgi:phosphatidylethanolamine/phosphatidyl-N-methylethanolamine N-methyltransferase|nr:methyltransferase domain-containing protein [Alphaproteobacteria bacterium]
MLENEQELPQFRQAVSSILRERRLFLRRWLAHPLRVAAMFPSSPALAELVAGQLPDPGERFILEVGAGTGAITRALLRLVPEERLILVELDEELCQWLKNRFPRATVLCGNAVDLPRLLPEARDGGSIAAIVSGIPIVQFPMAVKRAFVDSVFAMMGQDGLLLQYTYLPVSPLPCRRLGLDARRVGGVSDGAARLFLWRFTRRAGP